MSQDLTPPELFPDQPLGQAPRARERDLGAPRISEPCRDVMTWEESRIDDLIEWDHLAREVWFYVIGLNLSALTDKIAAREHGPGRNAVSPHLLLALWLYAIMDGVNSVRLLERLTTSENAYRWLCGGVTVNRTLLLEFREQQGELMDRLLTEGVKEMVCSGMVSLERLAQDGMKVRAAAASDSFRTKEGLKALERELEEAVRATRAGLEMIEDEALRERLERRLAKRAERKRERLRRCLETVAEREEEQSRRAKKDRIDPKTGRPKVVRVSTTDRECRVMKCAAGEMRPAYNMQATIDPMTGVIVDIEPETSGADAGQMAPAMERVQARYGVLPKELLADSGYCAKNDIAKVVGSGVEVTVQSNKFGKMGMRAYDERKREGWEWRRYRIRMQSPEAQESYRDRGKAEIAFAWMRRNGLRILPVRGKVKARTVAVMHALASNLQRMFGMRRRSAVA